MTSADQRLDAALLAVRRASAATRRVQRELADLALEKSDGSPVTVADFAAQAVVVLTLRETLDEPLLLVGEEDAEDLATGATAGLRTRVTKVVSAIMPGTTEADVLEAIGLGDHDGSAQAYWTLDPVDGTKGFLRGQQYAVALGYLEARQVTLGVLGTPCLSRDGDPAAVDAHGSLFAAARGQGAWAVSGDGDDRAPLRAAAMPDLSAVRMCESVESGHTAHDASAEVLDRIGARSAPVRIDSQCKYAVVAGGRADAYLRLPTRPGYREKIWDHAAGMLVVEEAGGIVTDIRGRPLDFSHGAKLLENRGVVCAVPGLHEKLVAALEGIEFPE